jgi:hypothetical protein
VTPYDCDASLLGVGEVGLGEAALEADRVVLVHAAMDGEVEAHSTLGKRLTCSEDDGEHQDAASDTGDHLRAPSRGMWVRHGTPIRAPPRSDPQES